jgi:uncharacterized membrane protein
MQEPLVNINPQQLVLFLLFLFLSIRMNARDKQKKKEGVNSHPFLRQRTLQHKRHPHDRLLMTDIEHNAQNVKGS